MNGDITQIFLFTKNRLNQIEYSYILNFNFQLINYL